MDDSSANQPDPAGVNWSSLSQRLMRCAASWFRDRGCYDEDSVLPNTGMSASDLVGRTIVNLLKGDLWRSTSAGGDLFPFAFQMMRNDFLDVIKRLEYKQTLITESINGEHKQSQLDALTDSNDIIEAIEAASLVNSLQTSLGLDEMERAYLDVWLVKSVAKREDIAYVLGITEQEATNIRRRLLYRLKPFMSPASMRSGRTKV